MKKAGKRGGLGRWVFLALLAAAAYLAWQYHRKGVFVDESALCGRFEAQVNDILSRDGVKDSDVLRTLRSEHRGGFPPTAWIETERQVRAAPGLPLAGIVAEIKQAAASAGLDRVSEDASPGRTFLECGKADRVFQRLIFVAAGAKVSAQGKRVAIVIDDIAGRPSDPRHLDGFLSLGVPITFAVLPFERATRSVCEKIHAAGQEIILHQPMEPEDIAHNNPGKAALLNAMGADEIERRLAKNLRNVPYAVGFSNHMGSRFTSDPRDMRDLLRALKKIKAAERRPLLFYFDSHTTPRMASRKLAPEIGVERLENYVFLDDKDDPAAMQRQLEILKREVLAKGSGASIGHIQRKYMVAALKRAIPEFKKEGIEFVHLSDLLEPAGESGR